MEQDTAKSNFHPEEPHYALVDLNRAGDPLLEIVTEPDLHTAEEAACTAKKIADILRALDICPASFDDGSIRVDVNVSLHDPASDSDSHNLLIHGRKWRPGVRTELKNIHSYKFIQQAINYEVDRHEAILNGNDPLALRPSTRGFDAATGKTFHLRSKESNPEYMIFPDPDLPTIHISPSFLDGMNEKLKNVELPDQLRSRLLATMPSVDTGIIRILVEQDVARFFENTVQEAVDSRLVKTNAELNDETRSTSSLSPREPRNVANWLIHNVFADLAKFGLDVIPITPKQLASLVDAVGYGLVPYHQARAQLSDWISQSSKG